jgi:hypothetical protein
MIEFLRISRSSEGEWKWMGIWIDFFTLSHLRTPLMPGCWHLSPDGTLKMRILFVQFGGIVECKKGKVEELVGLN